MKEYEEKMNEQEEVTEDLMEDFPETELPVREEILREALIRMMEREDKWLEEEIKRNGEHVFSERFEKKMAAILNGNKTEKTE